MPPESKSGERPLGWWCDIRRDLGISGSSFPLRLGILHRIMSLERLVLSKKWHDPGVDMTMTMQTGRPLALLATIVFYLIG